MHVYSLPAAGLTRRRYRMVAVAALVAVGCTAPALLAAAPKTKVTNQGQSDGPKTADSSPVLVQTPEPAFPIPEVPRGREPVKPSDGQSPGWSRVGCTTHGDGTHTTCYERTYRVYQEQQCASGGSRRRFRYVIERYCETRPGTCGNSSPTPINPPGLPGVIPIKSDGNPCDPFRWVKGTDWSPWSTCKRRW